MKSKICLTGIKPTGTPHLGNYIGSIKPALSLAKKENHQSFYFIADYHALINNHDKSMLEEQIYEVAASWLALGLDSEKTTLYQQSDIPEILELNWILSCFAGKGLLNRAHAYKAATDKNKQSHKDCDSGVSMGLFCYPVLMAADILFISSDIVPVGADQVQHIEIARDIAQTFNHTYGETLSIPESFVQKEAALVPGLDGRKMSKSYNNHIPLFLPEKKLRKLIMKIPTDSTPPETPKDPEQSNVFKLYQTLANPNQLNEQREKYQNGISWGEAKQELYELINKDLAPARERYADLMNNKKIIREILREGAERVRPKAQNLLQEVKERIGLKLK
ncbi:MAG: tryptophan--tRNA ligase [Zetaproteobacteria bacterium]|nr:tryptophan--tRNA ligase [Pseudobdellovibrionaceae bacterium]|tara:strand:- start:103 stop:1107 length:1005 start_codon:yes stop_codon:yes gene_type:complete